MAVVGTAKAIAEGGGNIGIGGHRTREVTYQVITDDPTDATVTVQLAPGMPQIGASYGPTDPGCVCIAVVPERKSRFVWLAHVIYSTDYDSLNQILSEPPEVEFPSEPGEEPILGQAAPTAPYPPSDPGSSEDPTAQTTVQWFKAKGIVNSAGNIYDPPATRRIVTPLFIITRNEASFSLATKVQYENTVNATSWNGLTSRQAFCRLISPQAQWFQPPTIGQARVLYWKIRYEFALRYETWDLVLPDAGPYYLEYTGGTAYRKPFLTPEGTPYIGLLDHSNSAQPGKKLAAGQDCQYLRWRRYRENDFSGLNINLNLTLQYVLTKPRGFVSVVDPSKTPVAVAG